MALDGTLDRTTNVRVKIERAKEHLGQLQSEITCFLNSNPYTRVVDYRSDPQSILAYISPTREVPPRLSTIAGDVIHNLRASLDLLAWQLVLANKGTPDHRTKFPFAMTSEEFEKKIASAAIQCMEQAAVDLIKKTKVYKEGNDRNELLYALHDLDIKDKHHLLLLTGCAFQMITADPEKSIAATRRLTGEDADTFPLMFHVMTPESFILHPIEDKTVVIRIPRRPQVQMEPLISFQVMLNEPVIIQSAPVLGMLQQFINLVEGTIKPFWPLLVSY